MVYRANQFQINHLVALIGESFSLYGPKKSNGKSVYELIKSANEIDWNYQRTVLPFKKVFYPNKRDTEQPMDKLAIIGMPMCDIAAMKIFLKQFEGSGLVPAREDLLIVGSDCQPDDNCFCNMYDLARLNDFDLFVHKDKGGFLVEARSWRGKELAAKAGLKETDSVIEHESKAKAERFDIKLTEENVANKHLTEDFWHGISNNCFGCGACSTVCPLCFCFRQDFKSCPDGNDKKCLNWDSCFGSEFSQIQNGYDLRPENTDRLYNWYHHKFVRGKRELGHPLCVGCGRCITACPAHLSIHNIIISLNKKYGPENQE